MAYIASNLPIKKQTTKVPENMGDLKFQAKSIKSPLMFAVTIIKTN